MNEEQNRIQQQEKEDNTGGIVQKFLDWSGISGAIEEVKSEQDNLERIKQAQEWINMPYQRRMEITYMQGGKYGGNLKEEQIDDPNSLRWFIYNLDDNKQVGTLQRKLNNFFKESGFDELPTLPVDSKFNKRTINRMNKFIEQYDVTYNRTQDTQEALRAVGELLYHRDNEFTIPSDTLELKQSMQDLNANEEATGIMKDLEMIPR